MSYLNKVRWEIEPENNPLIKRNCPKCSTKTFFKNTEKFRVNANKHNIDIWLIYQCENCKSTWNMTIYERINVKDINQDDYQKFLSNDQALAKQYGFDDNIHSKNKVELILDYVSYSVKESVVETQNPSKSELEIEIMCKYPLQLRVDKLLSENLKISRSQVKRMYLKGLIYDDQSCNLLKTKIKNGMKLKIGKNCLAKNTNIDK